MQKKKISLRLIALLLVVSMFSMFAGVGYAAGAPSGEEMASGILQKLSDSQLKALTQLHSGGLDAGLVGFEGDYALPGGSQKVPVIVEFVNPPAAVAQVLTAAQTRTFMSVQSAEDKAAADHAAFAAGLAAMFGRARTFTPAYEITAEYTEAINGVAITLPADRVAELADMDCVRAVYPDSVVKLDPGEMNAAMQVSSDEHFSYGMSDSRDFLGLDELHAAGYTGKGVKIGILDSGVDYNHPDLKDAFVYDARYGKYGRNLVTDGAPRDPLDPMETTYEEWLEYGAEEPESGAYITAHGTHVAGIAAARGANRPVSSKGVAPEATLVAYRVLGPGGYGWDSWILGALDKVGPDGCDVVNMSLGKSVNNALDPVATAVNNLIIAYDIFFALAAGNDGAGIATVGAPAGASLAMTVGGGFSGYSYEMFSGQIVGTTGSVTLFANVLPDGRTQTVLPNGDGTYRIDVPGLILNDDNTHTIVPITELGNPGAPVSKGFPEDYTPEVRAALAGNIALVAISQGEIYVLDQMKNAQEAGAKALMFSFMPGMEYGYIYAPMPIVGGIPVYDASLPNNFSASVSNLKITEVYEPERRRSGDDLAADSSRGPVMPGFEIKPDLIAPGSNVLSTVPYYVREPEAQGDSRYANAYIRMGGTSMASPHVAGAAALIRAAHRDWSALEIKARLMNSADPVKYNYYPAGVYDLGAGWLDIKGALGAESYVTTGAKAYLPPANEGDEPKVTDIESASLSFGRMYAGGTSTLSAFVNNPSIAAKTYSVSHVFGDSGAEAVIDERVTLAHPVTITVPAGGKGKLDFTLSLPADNLSSGSYEGYVYITCGEELYRLPFAAYVKGNENAFEIVRLDRPLMSNGDNSHCAVLSDRSSVILRLRYGLDIAYMTVYGADGVYMGEQEYALWHLNSAGSIHTYINAMQSTVYQWDTENDERVAIKLPEGRYTLRISGQGGMGGLDGAQIVELPFIVDNAPPVVSEVRVNHGTGSAYISGKLFDAGVETLKNAGIVHGFVQRIDYEPIITAETYDQSDNYVIVSYGGSMYGAYPDDDGDFSVKIDTAGGGAEALLYALDHFVRSDGTFLTDTSDIPSLTKPFLLDTDRTVCLGANISAAIPVTIDLSGPDMALLPESIVAELAANIHIEYDKTLDPQALSFALLDSNGSKLGDGGKIREPGKAVLHLGASPAKAGFYEVVMQQGDTVLASRVIEVVPYNRDIWSPVINIGNNGSLQIVFADKIAAKDGKFDTEIMYYGYPIECTLAADGKTLETKVPYYLGGTFEIKGVKYPDLFPSYSFTFTVTSSQTTVSPFLSFNPDGKAIIVFFFEPASMFGGLVSVTLNDIPVGYTVDDSKKVVVTDIDYATLKRGDAFKMAFKNLPGFISVTVL